MTFLMQTWKPNIVGPLGTKVEITQAELVAIFICALQIAKSRYGNSTIQIYTDSLAVIKALSAYKMDSILVMDCVKALAEVS